jgi:hypothetical protein
VTGAVVLDTRALELVADPRADARAAFLVRSFLRAAEKEETPVLVPTAVLAEAYRGGPEDAEMMPPWWPPRSVSAAGSLSPGTRMT